MAGDVDKNQKSPGKTRKVDRSANNYDTWCDTETYCEKKNNVAIKSLKSE